MNELCEEWKHRRVKERKMDSEGPRQIDQGVLTCETDKERTWCSFKGPGYNHRKIEGYFDKLLNVEKIPTEW